MAPAMLALLAAAQLARAQTRFGASVEPVPFGSIGASLGAAVSGSPATITPSPGATLLTPTGVAALPITLPARLPGSAGAPHAVALAPADPSHPSASPRIAAPVTVGTGRGAKDGNATLRDALAAFERTPIDQLIDGAKAREGRDIGDVAAPALPNWSRSTVATLRTTGAPSAEPEPPKQTRPNEGAVPLSWIPNAITAMNMTSGLGAILAASHGAPALAAGLIVLANVFDAFDGRAARALGVEGTMGVHLDSLADVVSFGVAPAILLWPALAGAGALGFAAGAAYAFAGVFRLARFNDGVLKEKPGAAHSDSFTGLPIPGGAGVIVAAVLALPLLPAALAPAIAIGVALATGAAMASTIPYPAMKHASRKTLAGAGALALAAAAVPAILGAWSLVPAAVFGLYLLAGPAAWIYRRLR